MGGLEEHNCDLPSFSSNVAPGYRPRIPYRKEINKSLGGCRRGHEYRRPTENCDLMKEPKGC